MSSSVVQHTKLASMSIGNLLNRSPSPPPRVQPQNARRPPPTPQVNQAYRDHRVAETGYSLAGVDDTWGQGVSRSPHSYPAPMRASYPPNHNLRLIPPNTPRIGPPIVSKSPMTASPYPEERTVAVRKRASSNASYESAAGPVRSDKRAVRPVTNVPRARTSRSVTPMDTDAYSGESGRSTFSLFRLDSVPSDYAHR
ncbi:hypothetical protein K438DRAFT_51888 [Mycena galopus ATCC 62051]|nr:hypothetical protein K438DRAFT_51888 [Mycena galopus ATCC 62051]